MSDLTTAPPATPDRRTARRLALAEQQRRNADAAVERRNRALLLDLEAQERRRDLQRRHRDGRRRQRQARRAARKQRRAARWARLRQAAPAWADRALFAGPILFPMAVAWIGQIQFARTVMGWPLAGAVVFAAGFEASTAYVARLDWKARADGDTSVLFRAATWVFAGGAATMNYWHAADPGFAPTGEAVSYGAMSIAGVVLWELLSLYRHRARLRANGLLPPRRPRFGLARWLWFPRVTHLARLLALRDGHATTEQAWHASLDAVATHGSARAAIAALRGRRPNPPCARDCRRAVDETPPETPDPAAAETGEPMTDETTRQTADETTASPADETPAATDSDTRLETPAETQNHETSNAATTRRRAPRETRSAHGSSVKARMIRYAAAQRGKGRQVSGAELDRRFGTTNYGSRILRELDSSR